MANEQGDVHVIYDYQNVIYIDPQQGNYKYWGSY